VWSLAGVLFALALLPGTASAQASQPARTIDDLRRSVPQATTQAAQQLRIRWTVDAPVADPARAANTFDLIASQPVVAAMRPDRSPQIIPPALVLVSVDTSGREGDWRSMPDPRVVRADIAPNATARPERLYYVDLAFVALIPQLPDVSELRIYSARRVSGETVLDPLGSVTLPPR
jgi:hypothetical protein